MSLCRMRFISKGVFTKNAYSKYGGFIIPITVFILATLYDRNVKQEQCRSFHNKSALYGGRDLKPGERIWWPMLPAADITDLRYDAVGWKLKPYTGR